MFAYIPARGGSKRIPRKNIYPINGKPLLSYVLGQLTLADGLSGIAVSSEDDEILKVATTTSSKVTTLKNREDRLAQDLTTFMDLINNDIQRYADHFKDNDVLFVLPTSVLVTSSYYNQAITYYNEHKDGLVLSVTESHPSPLLSFIQSGDSLVPLFPEMFNRPTKDLPFTCVDCGCFYIFNLEKMKNKKMFIDLTPIHPIVLPRDIGVDVDTVGDINFLKKNLGRENE